VDPWRDRAQRAAEAVGTPCYVTAWAPVRDAALRLERLAEAAPVRSWLSYKTHPLPALARAWIKSGRGVEVVSERELVSLLELGCPIDLLLVNGVAKHAWLGGYEIPRLRVHFDSQREAEALLGTAVRLHWRVGVRVHAPDESDTRDTRFGGQFGLDDDEAVGVLRHLRAAGADVQSVHFHLGQRRQDPNAYARAVARVADVCDAAGVAPAAVDCGGGLPPGHDAALAPALEGLAIAMRLAEARFPSLQEIWLENGRFITEESSALVVAVLDVKERSEGRYLICDGGRTNHALAADHHVHPLLLLPDRGGRDRLTTICGPTCMTDDRLGRWLLPDSVAPGDRIVWLNAGAYHLPWETRFSYGLCAVAWVDEDETIVVARPRERVQEWAPQ
jgi:diaminopimelate decarboxylase